MTQININILCIFVNLHLLHNETLAEFVHDVTQLVNIYEAISVLVKYCDCASFNLLINQIQYSIYFS